MSEMERDPRVDAAWNTASREEPPVALDDAIRAAARKALHAQPRRARDKHWWYPFAAAATVAVIALGLLQTTPPEQIAPTLVADAGRTQKEDAHATVVTPGPPPEATAATIAAPATPPSTFARPTPAPLKKESRASEARLAAAPAQNATQRERNATDKLAQSTKPAEAESAAANKPAQLQASAPAAPPPRPEPFPAAPQSAAQPAPVERRDASASNANSMEGAPVREPAAAPPGATPRLAGAQQLAGAAVGEQRAQRQAMLSKDEASPQPRAKTAPPRSVEDWIKLIRELRNEGRTDEARKEIVAFRSAYGEQADSLLPQDLREFAPPAPKQ
jgi:hypothetical protein